MFFIGQLVIYAVISVVVHFALLGTVFTFSEYQQKPTYQKVKLKVNVAEVKEEPPPPPPAPPPPPPPKPKKIEEAKVVKKEIKQAQVIKQQDVPQQKATETPVQGLNKDSFVPGPGPGGFAAPVGNTTMAQDEGKRLKPEEVQALKQDLSAPAKLVLESVKAPEYTPAAIDAGIEGVYKVEVYIDEEGRVAKVELSKRVGYQMDDRLLDSARGTKWLPRRDELGRAIAGWTSFTFTLKLP